MKILFICHNNESIQFVYNKVKQHSNMYIIFVGDKKIKEEYEVDEKIMIARNYPDNIEKSKKLLTFTAWYLIIQNNLFATEDHLCILEYDVQFDDYFLEQLTTSYMNYDLISFQSRNDLFEADISMTQLTEYLSQHNLPYLKTWWPTTNHCIKRELLAEFVNFYMYTYKDISDEDNISFYHERIFSSYTHHTPRLILNGLTHVGIYSHQYFRYKKYLVCYDNDPMKTDILIHSVNQYSPDTEVIRCSQDDIPTPVWKPTLIYEILKSIEPNATLMFVDNQQRFTNEYDELYMRFQYIKAWKDDKPINHEYVSQIIPYNFESKMPVLLRGDIILFENKPETIRIVKQWLDLCVLHPETNIPNYVDIIFSIIINMYSACYTTQSLKHFIKN